MNKNKGVSQNQYLNFFFAVAICSKAVTPYNRNVKRESC